MSKGVWILTGGCVVLGLVWNAGLLSFAGLPATGEARDGSEGAVIAARDVAADVLRRAREAPEVGGWETTHAVFGSGNTRWEDTLTFETSANGLSVLDVHTPHGNVDIVGDDGDSIRVSARRIVRSKSESKGATYRDGFRPIVRRDGGTLVVDVVRPEGKDRPRPKHVKEAYLGFTITAPSRLADGGIETHGPALHIRTGHGDVGVKRVEDGTVALSTGHGDIVLSDIAGDVDLHTGHGDIAVTDAELGVLKARTGHGDVIASDVRGSATISSGHGDVRLARVEGGVEARTGHGEIDIKDCAGSLALHTGHGNLAIGRGNLDSLNARSGAGDISAEFDTATGVIDLKTGKGDLALRANGAQAVSAHSGRGDIDAHIEGEVAEGVAINTSHGDISVKAARAATLTARSGSGSVHVGAVRVDGLLDVNTGNGDIGVIAEDVGELVAHSGTGLVEAVVVATEGRAELRSGNGDISLTVGGDLPFALDASTSHGDVSCRVDLEDVERHKNGRSVRGTRLGGGPEIRLRTGRGDVAIRTR